MSRGKLTVLVGGQYGSEGKGKIAAHVADKYDAAVRVGSYNAGHTFYWHGDKHVMQAIPCGWINPNATIIIGRGAIEPIEGLLSEIEHIEKYYPDFKKRLVIDANAGVLEDKYHEAEGGKDGWFNAKIGSTGEGCGAARIARMQRDPSNFHRISEIADSIGLGECIMEDTPRLIAKIQDAGFNIMIEGTQGSGLSLLHSHWPYCTSIDTNAAGVISEVGIAPTRVTDVLMVVRTYPIRVAGNSGPMKNEVTWDYLSEALNKEITPEKTTVTHKVRRIAQWDKDLFRNACLLNAPTEIALTFADYIDPDIYDSDNVLKVLGSEKLRKFIKDSGIAEDGHLKYIGTGANGIVEVQ